MPSSHRLHKLLQTRIAPEYVKISDTFKSIRDLYILRLSKVEKFTPNTMRKRGFIECQNQRSQWNKITIDFPAYTVLWRFTTVLDSKKDCKSSSDSEAKPLCVTTPINWFKVGWTSIFTRRPAMHFKDIILVIWASVRPSNRKVPLLCLLNDYNSPIC